LPARRASRSPGGCGTRAAARSRGSDSVDAELTRIDLTAADVVGGKAYLDVREPPRKGERRLIERTHGGGPAVADLRAHRTEAACDRAQALPGDDLAVDEELGEAASPPLVTHPQLDLQLPGGEQRTRHESVIARQVVVEHEPVVDHGEGESCGTTPPCENHPFLTGRLAVDARSHRERSVDPV